MPVSVERLGNGTGADPDVEVEAVAVAENWMKRLSEVNGLTLAALRGFFGAGLFGAGLAEARISAALLGSITTEGRQNVVLQPTGSIWHKPGDRTI